MKDIKSGKSGTVEGLFSEIDNSSDVAPLTLVLPAVPSCSDKLTSSDIVYFGFSRRRLSKGFPKLTAGGCSSRTGFVVDNLSEVELSFCTVDSFSEIAGTNVPRPLTV